MVVAGIGNRHAKQILIIVHGFEHRGEKQQKLLVFHRRFAGLEQVFPALGADGPVVVLARAVHALVGLFMQQTDQPVPLRHLFHHGHHQQVLIHCKIQRHKHGCQLMLPRRHLVVLGFGKHAKAPQFFVHLRHKFADAGFEGSEIMILQLLPFGRRRAEQRAPGIKQILAAAKKLRVGDKILLLSADGGLNPLGAVIPEKAQQSHALGGKRVHGAKQGRFGVQRFPGVGAECSGDIQRSVLDKGKGRGVPRGVATCLKRGAQPPGGEGGSIRLPFNQLLARKFHHRLPVADRGDKSVMLFGSDTREGLEPMRVMGSSLFDCPILHGICHGIGNRGVDLLAFLNDVQHCLKYTLRQALSHHLFIEYHIAENFGHVFHPDTAFPILSIHYIAARRGLSSGKYT